MDRGRLLTVMDTTDWTLFGTSDARRNYQVEAQFARLHLLLMMIRTAVAHATWGRRQRITRISALALFLGILAACTDDYLLEATVLPRAGPTRRVAATTTVS